MECHVEGSKKSGALFLSHCNEEYSILGSIVGPLIFGTPMSELAYITAPKLEKAYKGICKKCEASSRDLA